MNRHVNAISGRLSLRPPQRESLAILARVAEIVPLAKERDLAAALATVRAEFPTVTDFEREFPSLCFALATGVGKTRLMGAFIAYLYLDKGIRNFFVLAPNRTIYEKLVADFTPSTPKYVFQGIAEFATSPPEIVTGENYEVRGGRTLFGVETVRINILNIDKINKDVRSTGTPRIKRLSEYIGQSYFDYLAGLDDLVLLMDESHRYRATAGVRAINELRPVLGLELTATPYVEVTGGRRQFQNIIFDYPLPQAMEDGFVKEPAVATRENFDPAQYTPEELERLKLEDGVRVHESVKLELQVYAEQQSQPTVKPFMLVVARDTEHADALMAEIKGDAFFEGRYKERVITVHANQRGEEREETVERLLAVENSGEPTEIVIHVNMLKEGWDVKNLYTIVPLRAANSRTLVEQCIGRGLRLPYGRRVGVPSVDRLAIVAHDRFQEIIDEANRPDSILRAGIATIVVGRDVPLGREQRVDVEPEVVRRLTQSGPESGAGASSFSTAVEREIAKSALEVIRSYEWLHRSAELKTPETQTQIVGKVSESRAAYASAQGELEGLAEPPDVAAVVAKTVDLYLERTIDIPRIIVVPRGEITCGFDDFDLDVSDFPWLPPVPQEILIHHLRTNEQARLANGNGTVREDRPEDYLVSALVNYDDICYDDHSDLLYRLASQAVAYLRSYLADEEAVENVLQSSQRQLTELIYRQMQRHYRQHESGYDVQVSKGFTTLRSNSYVAPAGERPRNFLAPVDERQDIRRMLFDGFRRCLYAIQKFDSDVERRFAILLEGDSEVLKWFKPARGQLHIYYGEGNYEPDFVVETRSEKLLCETKRASEIEDDEVQAKAHAAWQWCEHATAHERAHGGKPWSYLLIPHDAIAANRTLGTLAARYRVEVGRAHSRRL